MNQLKLEFPTPTEWFVLKGKYKYGPYSYTEMIGFIQDQMLYKFDYVWNSNLESWTCISDLSEFSEDRLQSLVKSNPNHDVFKRRQHTRVLASIPIYAHDNKKVWPATTETLSEGGASIKINNPSLLPGDTINLHFKSGPDWNAFNCQAQIIAKKYTKSQINKNTSFVYAIKFSEIPESSVQQINQFINLKKGA